MHFEVVEAVQGKIEVYLDGGVRKGTDVLGSCTRSQGCVCWSTSALGTSLQGLCIPPVMLYCLSTTGLGRGGSERGVATTEGGVPSSNGTVRMPECTQHH